MRYDDKSNAEPLFLKWAGANQGVYACKKWHYSKTCPRATANIAVYESGRFAGIIQFGAGNSHIGSPFNLDNSECRELARVALRNHQTPVSRMIAIALKMLKRRMPFLKLVVSYADSNQGHHGGIYQAGGWVYVGPCKSHTYWVKGRSMHGRSLYSLWGANGQRIAWLRKHVDRRAERLNLPCKHKYLYPLTEEMRAAIMPLAKPYPKRAGSIVRCASFPS